jgi:hypothetical protein
VYPKCKDIILDYLLIVHSFDCVDRIVARFIEFVKDRRQRSPPDELVHCFTRLFHSRSIVVTRNDVSVAAEADYCKACDDFRLCANTNEHAYN